MSEAVLFPYPHAENALALSCRLSGVEQERKPSGAILVAQDLANVPAVAIEVSVRLAPGTVEKVVPPSGDGWAAHRVVVTFAELTTRLRSSIELEPEEGDGEYRGRIQLRTDELATELTLTPYLVLAEAAKDERFAQHVGAVVASGAPLDVLIREPPTPPGGYLDIEFEDFAQSTHPVRRSNARLLYALDLEGLYPKLWLNRGVDGFERIMRSVARRGAPRRIRDATYNTICCQIWTSLLSTSLAGLRAIETPGDAPIDAISNLPDWQQRVIHYWAPRLYPELNNRDQALREITRVVARPELVAELQERIVLGIQAFANSTDVFFGLLRFETGEGL